MQAFNLSTYPTQHGLTPFADVYDLEDRVVVFADMPGVSREGVDIRVVNNQLMIRGRCSRGGANPPQSAGVRLIRECPRCDYYRLMKLSNAIDAEAIQAQIEDGVLTLTLPKKQSGQPVEIPISTE